MKKSLSFILIGLFYIFYFFSLLINSKFGFDPIAPFFGVFGFILLFNGILNWKEYYRINLYSALLTTALAGILILSYIQASKSYLITYFYISVGILILITILAVYDFNRKIKNYQTIENYNKSLEIDPEDFKAWTNKGNAFMELKEHEKAIESYDKALEINPQFTTAWYNKGIALAELRKYQKAIESYDAGLKIGPNNAKMWNNKGIILTKLGKYQEALECYENALKIDSKNARTWFNKGIVLEILDKYQEALEYFDKALELDPKDVKTWYNKGNVLQKLGRDQGSFKCYEKALKLDPDFESAKKKIHKRFHFLNIK